MSSVRSRSSKPRCLAVYNSFLLRAMFLTIAVLCSVKFTLATPAPPPPIGGACERDCSDTYVVRICEEDFCMAFTYPECMFCWGNNSLCRFRAVEANDPLNFCFPNNLLPNQLVWKAATCVEFCPCSVGIDTAEWSGTDYFNPYIPELKPNNCTRSAFIPNSPD